jgi:hypothetical protein
MRAEDLERIEAAAGDLLKELGFPRAVSDPAQEKLEEATRIHHAVTQEVRTQGMRLPKHW